MNTIWSIRLQLHAAGTKSVVYVWIRSWRKSPLQSKDLASCPTVPTVSVFHVFGSGEAQNSLIAKLSGLIYSLIHAAKVR